MCFPGRSRQRLTLFFILLVGGLGLYLGWRLFWFLTDDAYISFRYISNSVLGYGYTWNFPPFRAVEGYTNFLWIVLLDVVWRMTGVAPPDSANGLSLLFAYGTTLLGVVMMLKMALKPALQKVRLLLLALVLLGVLTNRTYLAWTSSGLETAMFNFFATAWAFSCLFLPACTFRCLAWMALTSVLAALTRPDGLLLVTASLCLSGLTWGCKINKGDFRFRLLFAASPFLITMTHFVWRKCQYGAWLPNTYVAKYSAPWPESGWRYFLSFVIEYALWFWIVLALVFLVKLIVNGRFRRMVAPFNAWLRELTPTRPLIILTVVGTFVAHWAYYTFVIGGDHFEYRVYSHLVLLLFVSSVWILNQLSASPGAGKPKRAWLAVAFLSLFILCGLPIPWSHWMATHNLQGREVTFSLHVPLAPKFPAVMRPYIRFFDTLQGWLIDHAVCIRHQEHKDFYRFMIQGFPSRSRGILLSPDNFPVMAADAVGVPGWVLPTTNIIDVLGLNDYVIARNSVLTSERRMAHARTPPVGYVECFHPNVKLVGQNKIVVAPHDLDAETIIHCENHDWPPSMGDKYASVLNISAADTPRVDDYLWEVWPSDFLYLYFVPPEQHDSARNERLLEAFSTYNGSGCVVVPPLDEIARHNGRYPKAYALAFLPALGRPELSALTSTFPWTRFVTEHRAQPPFIDTQSPYHLGYMALAGSEMTLRPDHGRTEVWMNGLRFLGYDGLQTTYQPGDTIYLTLYFRLDQSIQPGHSVFVHLSGPHNPDTGNALWGQDDGALCRGLYPMRFWESGAGVMAKMAVSIPEDAPMRPSPDDLYELAIGFYNWKTGRRIPLADTAPSITGRTYEDKVVLTQIHLKPSQF